MRNAPLTAVVLILHSNCGSALFPGVKHVHSKRGMSGLRRRLTWSSVPEADTTKKQPSIGSRFWKRKSESIITRNKTKLQEGKGEKEVEPSRRGDDLLLSISDVIHLGKLQIPPSRRLSLTTTRSLPDVSANSIAVAQRPSLLLEDDKIAVDAPSEARGKVGIDGTSSSDASLATGGDPSVIPCGVSGDDLDMGVVQIPLRFTVGETVKFIRAVANDDHDSSRTVEPDAGGRVAAERGAVGEASEVLPGLLDDSHKRQTTLSSRIYVTEDGRLRGFITMAALLTHQPETPVQNLLLEMKELLREGDIWEDAVHRLRLANVMAAPVVDSDGILVAVVNPGDLMKEMEIEATDDIMRQSGSGGGETYFGTPLPRLVASRVGWLVSLLCLQSLSSLILQNYQHVIEKNMVIALFLTMLTGTAGNAGNQSSAIVIRGLATGEINQRNRWRVIWRESRAAVASAVVLSFAAFGRVYMTPGATTVATLAVAMAMGATVIGAVLFGTVAPIVLDGMGVDPVNFASPALATLTDVSGVFILCSIAKMMLRNVG